MAAFTVQRPFFFRRVRADDRPTPSTMLFECQLPRPDSVSAKRRAAIVTDVLALEDGIAEGETGNADVAASAVELRCLSVWFLYRRDDKDQLFFSAWSPHHANR